MKPMKLKLAGTSPYARKVRVLAIELGLLDELELETVAMSIGKSDPGVVAQNPLGKIPVLEIEGGYALYDSCVICEYLSARAGDSSWFPALGPARWDALRLQALADGMMEAGQLIRAEATRPEGMSQEPLRQWQLLKIERSFAYLERNPPTGNDIGAIAVASALSWLNVRFPELGWHPRMPNLARWYDTFAQRPSFTSTMPKV